jgi:hypothetical protein
MLLLLEAFLIDDVSVICAENELEREKKLD